MLVLVDNPGSCVLSVFIVIQVQSGKPQAEGQLLEEDCSYLNIIDTMEE